MLIVVGLFFVACPAVVVDVAVVGAAIALALAVAAVVSIVY